MLQLIQSSDHNFSNLLGEEFEFSFRRNEFSMISPQGNCSILLKPCGETVKFSTRRKENSISSPKWIGEFRKEQWSNFRSIIKTKIALYLIFLKNAFKYNCILTSINQSELV